MMGTVQERLQQGDMGGCQGSEGDQEKAGHWGPVCQVEG